MSCEELKEDINNIELNNLTILTDYCKNIFIWNEEILNDNMAEQLNSDSLIVSSKWDTHIIKHPFKMNLHSSITSIVIFIAFKW